MEILQAEEFTEEMKEWCGWKNWEENRDYMVRPHEVCVKHVMMPTENQKNKYETDGVEIWFNDKNKCMEFKLRWHHLLRNSTGITSF